ncbi:MAG: response regulator [Gemmataceae bacterium]
MEACVANAAGVAAKGEPGWAFGYQLLRRPTGDGADLVGLMGELAAAFEVDAAGLTLLGATAPLVCHPVDRSPPVAGWPWQADPTVLSPTRQVPGATVLDHDGRRLVVTTFADGEASPVPGSAGGLWVLWLDDAPNRAWTDDRLAALALAGDALGRWVRSDRGAHWVNQLERWKRQQGLEAAALVTRRLAHDFGNLLTGILGFVELALAQQLPTNTPLHSYLDEVYRSAQNGAAFTQHLRLFSRRQASSSRFCRLTDVLAEQRERLLAARPSGLTVRLDLPADLPLLAIDAEPLRLVLAALLDNASEAVAGPGTVSVSARPIDLSAADCLDLYGSAQPGPHVEVVIADTGSGLTSEAQRVLFQQPFFSSKPRHRGFGLAISYGVLHAHRGGLRLYPGEEYGVVVRLVLPVSAIAPAPLRGHETAVRPSQLVTGDRVLVVEDDIETLKHATRALERAGYRVQAVTSTEAALQRCAAEAADPYRAVLTAVAMPVLNGIELARRLLRQDAAPRLLLLAGRATPDPLPRDLTAAAVSLLVKPVDPDYLVRAVRAALDGAPAGPSVLKKNAR